MAEEEKQEEAPEKSLEEIKREKFEEARADTFALALGCEDFRRRAYRVRRESDFTIGCGNKYHPKNSKYKGRKVRDGDVIAGDEKTKKLYFESAYNKLFSHISKNLNMEKMNHDQMVAVCDLLYNRGQKCLTNNDCALSETLNTYLEEPTIENGILPSLYMTAKRDSEKDMSGLRKRRDTERRLLFGENAEEIIQATNAIKTVNWKKLSQSELKTLAGVVAECGPECLTGENAELPKLIKQYTQNPTPDNQKLFYDCMENTRYMKYIQRPENKDKIGFNIKDMMNEIRSEMDEYVVRAKISDLKLKSILKEQKEDSKDIDENTSNQEDLDVEEKTDKTDNKGKTISVPLMKDKGYVR